MIPDVPGVTKIDHGGSRDFPWRVFWTLLEGVTKPYYEIAYCKTADAAHEVCRLIPNHYL